jgi:hypothetical protein
MQTIKGLRINRKNNTVSDEPLVPLAANLQPPFATD